MTSFLSVAGLDLPGRRCHRPSALSNGRAAAARYTSALMLRAGHARRARDAGADVGRRDRLLAPARASPPISSSRTPTSGPATPRSRRATAVAVIGDRIVDVGGADEIERWRGANTTVLDAEGRRLVPGFNDAHVHFVDGGTQLDNVDLTDAGDAGGVRAAHQRAREGEAGRVDSRRPLGRAALDAGRAADARADRRRHQFLAGVRRPLRRPHGARQRGRARARRDHRDDAGSAGRRDRARRATDFRPAC